MLDVSDFDAKISDLTKKILDAQTAVDTDPLGAQLAALNIKSKTLADLQDTLALVQANKDKAIVVQDQIDVNAAQLVDLKETAKI